MSEPKKSRSYRVLVRDGFKKCSKCEIVKSENEFFARKDRAGGRQSRCKACYNASVDPKKSAIRQAEYRALYPGRALAARQRYRLNHKAKELKRVAKFRKEHPEINRINCSRRRARKLKADGSYALSDIIWLLKIQNKKCAFLWCGKVLGDSYQVDHIQPLARGGSNDKRNIQLLCPLCNMQKHAKHPIDFAQRNGFLL